jgi:CheY-like chemotaxis protein
MPSLLLVEDETKLRKLLLRALEGNLEWTTRAVDSAEAAMR